MMTEKRGKLRVGSVNWTLRLGRVLLYNRSSRSEALRGSSEGGRTEIPRSLAPPGNALSRGSASLSRKIEAEPGTK